MVPWWAIPLALAAGILIGFVIIALLSANEDDD